MNQESPNMTITTHQSKTDTPASVPVLSSVQALAAARRTVEENGRERLKRHRGNVAGRVRIPEMWGQEEMLKEWIDGSAFNASLVPSGIMTARVALAQEGMRASSARLRI